MTDRPHGDAAGQDLRDHEGLAGIRDTSAAGEQVSVEMEGRLAAIDQTDIHEGQAIFVSQRG